jgi:acyl dehydratase
MAINTAFAGRTLPPSEPYEVSRVKIAEFADAVGNTSAVHRDPAAAQELGYRDVIAPPTFAVLISQQAEMAYVLDPAAGIDFTRTVHANERFVHHRPITAGDWITATTTVDSIQDRGLIALATTRTELTTVEGEPVATVYSTLAVRGE